MNKVKKNLVAVYGTLRKGFGNYSTYLDNDGVKYLGEDLTKKEYTMYSINSGFPGVVHKGKTAITIEVFEILEPSIISSLDALEGYPRMYVKEKINTKYGKATIYIWNYETNIYPTIVSGDWNNPYNEERVINDEQDIEDLAEEVVEEQPIINRIHASARSRDRRWNTEDRISSEQDTPIGVTSWIINNVITPNEVSNEVDIENLNLSGGIENEQEEL